MATSIRARPSQSSSLGGFWSFISQKTSSVAAVPAISDVSRFTSPAKVAVRPLNMNRKTEKNEDTPNGMPEITIAIHFLGTFLKASENWNAKERFTSETGALKAAEAAFMSSTAAFFSASSVSAAVTASSAFARCSGLNLEVSEASSASVLATESDSASRSGEAEACAATGAVVGKNGSSTALLTTLKKMSKDSQPATKTIGKQVKQWVKEERN